MAKQETVQFTLPIEMPKADFEAVAQISKSDVISTLKSWVPWWVKNQIGGGIMLQPQHVEHLNKLKGDGEPFREAAEIVKHVEKALGREEGQFVFPVAVDPAKMPSIIERARECGVAPEDLITRAVNTALSHPHLMAIVPSMDETMVFEPGQLQELGQLIGKGVPYGVDVIAALRRLTANGKAVAA